MKTKDNLIRKLYLKSLPPNILAVLGGTVNVLADSILVGRKLGETGLAAVNQSLTIYLLLCTLGSLIASGCSYKSAVAMGDNQVEEAQKYYQYALSYGVILSVIICLIGMLCLNPVSRILSSQMTYEYVKNICQLQSWAEDLKYFYTSRSFICGWKEKMFSQQLQ